MEILGGGHYILKLGYMAPSPPSSLSMLIYSLYSWRLSHNLHTELHYTCQSRIFLYRTKSQIFLVFAGHPPVCICNRWVSCAIWEK